MPKAGIGGLLAIAKVAWLSTMLPAIAAMAALQVTHLPAGVDPLVALFDSPGWGYIVLPVAVGRFMLDIIVWLYHRLQPRIICLTPEQE